MDRRQFIAGGLLLGGTTAGAVYADRTIFSGSASPQLASSVIEASEVGLVLNPLEVSDPELSKHAGKRLLVKGWLRPADNGADHYFILTAQKNGPNDKHAVRVLPADTRQVSAGYVQMEGRYFRGKFVDVPTEELAFAVLTEAV